MADQQQHPITPPTQHDEDFRELAAKWVAEIYGDPAIPLHPITLRLVKRAAQWGADQELEACVQYFDNRGHHFSVLDALRLARRPKMFLKKQALKELEILIADLSNHGMGFKATNIRRALEALPDE